MDFIQPTISPKTIFFIYTLLFTIPFFLIFLWSRSFTIRIRISRIDLCLLLFLGFVMTNRYLIQDFYGFSIRFIELLGLAFLYLLLRQLSLKFYHWLLLSIVISGIIQALYGSLQILGYLSSFNSRFNLTGSFSNPGPYAGFLAGVWPVALGLFLYKDDILSYLKLKYKIEKQLFTYLPILGLVTIFIVLPSTQSRAAWLACLASSGLLYVFKVYKKKRITNLNIYTKNRKKIILLLVLVTGASLFGLYHFKKNSAKGRSLIWKVCTEIIQENSLFGVGYDRFQTHYMDFQANYFSKKDEAFEKSMLADNTTYAFNEILQLWVENGFISLLPCILIVIFLIQSNRRGNRLNKIFLSVLFSLAVFGLFSYPNQILPIKMIGILALSVLSKNDSTCIAFKIGELFSNKQKGIFKALITLLIIFSMTKIYQKTKEIEHGFKNWKIAMDNYNYDLYENSIKGFESIMHPLFYCNGNFLMNYGKALQMSGQNQKAIIILERSKLYFNNTIIQTTLGDAYKESKEYTKAEAAYQHAINMIPHKLYPYYLLAKLYDDSGESKKAYVTARIFLSKSIKIPSRAVKEMTIEMELILSKYEKKSSEIQTSK